MCPPMGNITSLITRVIGSVWGRRGVGGVGGMGRGLPELSICRAGFEPCASWLKKEREDVCAFFLLRKCNPSPNLMWHQRDYGDKETNKSAAFIPGGHRGRHRACKVSCVFLCVMIDILHNPAGEKKARRQPAAIVARLEYHVKQPSTLDPKYYSQP